MKEKLIQLFTNDKFIVLVIVINAIIIFLQESNVSNYILNLIDVLCTLIFTVEMLIKNKQMGIRNYWKSGVNALDGVLVLISLPSVLAFFWPTGLANLSFLLVLRIFRIFRFFRLVRLFPNFTNIVKNFRIAIRRSYAILLGFFILIVTVALLGCCMFRDAAPELFGTPMDGIYTTFRFFTIEGWYEIPDTVAEGMQSEFWAHLVRVYFCFLLLLGGIIGMSLINSVFVDAMVSDNNDDVKVQIVELNKKIDELMKALEDKKS